MKYPKTCLAVLALSATALSFAQTLSRPAKPDGSNASRAPFPAERPFDDVKPADGEAVDQGVPPNTPATAPAPAPAPAIAVFGPAPEASASASVATSTPAASAETLSPTGRSTVAVATSLESTRIVPSIRSATHASRDQVITDIEARLSAADKSLGSVRSSSSEMSATGRTQFKAAEDAAKEKEKALRDSIRAARNASSAEWESARSKLAADYEAYVAAVGSLDASAGLR